MLRALAIACISLLLVVGALAVEPGEVLDDPALEARARSLSAELRCLVCQNQSIDDSNAPLAKDLRVLVRERLQAGQSDAQVVDFLVARYGEFILLRPRFSAKTVLLWVGPFAIGLAGLCLAGLMLWRRPMTPPPALSADEQREVDQVLGGLGTRDQPAGER